MIFINTATNSSSKKRKIACIGAEATIAIAKRIRTNKPKGRRSTSTPPQQLRLIVPPKAKSLLAHQHHLSVFTNRKLAPQCRLLIDNDGIRHRRLDTTCMSATTPMAGPTTMKQVHGIPEELSATPTLATKRRLEDSGRCEQTSKCQATKKKASSAAMKKIKSSCSDSYWDDKKEWTVSRASWDRFEGWLKSDTNWDNLENWLHSDACGDNNGNWNSDNECSASFTSDKKDNEEWAVPCTSHLSDNEGWEIVYNDSDNGSDIVDKNSVQAFTSQL